MNWSIRYAGFNPLQKSWDSNGYILPRLTVVGKGGSLYERQPDNTYIKTLHPVAFERYKEMRPGMYDEPSQTYAHTLFSSKFDPYDLEYLNAAHYLAKVSNIDIPPGESGLLNAKHFLSELDRRLSSGKFPEASQFHERVKRTLSESKDHDVAGIIPSRDPKIWWPQGARNFDSRQFNYHPELNDSIFNIGDVWWGRGQNGESSRGGHVGHDVHALFSTPEEANEYIRTPEAMDFFENNAAWGKGKR
jgi:hypothetical protein